LGGGNKVIQTKADRELNDDKSFGGGDGKVFEGGQVEHKTTRKNKK